MESLSHVALSPRQQSLSRTDIRGIGHTLLIRATVVQKLIRFAATTLFRRRIYLPLANLGPQNNARSSVEIGSLEYLNEDDQTLYLALTLQQSLLSAADVWTTKWGTMILRIMPKA